MSEPKRIQLRRTKGWLLPPNTVVVSRPTKWGNPFKVHGDGHPMARRIAVDLFRKLTEDGEWFSQPLPWPKGKIPSGTTTVEQVRSELRGKDLACWCPLLDESGDAVPCHADVLLEIANHRVMEEQR